MKTFGREMWEKMKKGVSKLQRRYPLLKKAISFARKRKRWMCCAAVTAFLLFVLLLAAIMGGSALFAMTIIVAILLAVLICAVNSLYKLWTRWEKPTSYFSNLKHRNTEGLVLGSTKAWKYVQSNLFHDSEKELYNCTAYHRSLNMDFCTLKTYYSHVKKNGKVFILFDYSEARKMGNRILPRDFQYIHPHCFLYLGLKEEKRKSRWPILFYPGETIGFVWCKMLKYLGYYRKKTWKVSAGRNVNIDTEKVYQMAAILDQMLNFCWDRKLQPVLILLNGNGDNNMTNKILKAWFAPRYYFYEVNIVDDAEGLNQLIGRVMRGREKG